MKLIIIRHADPDYPNNTLTPTGFVEAKALGDYYKDFKFDEIYSSPLNRAKFTADEIVKHHPDKNIIVYDWLREFDKRTDLPDGQKNHITWDFYPSYYTNDKELYDVDHYLEKDFYKNAGIDKEYYHACEEFDKILAAHGYVRENKLYHVEKESTETLIFVCHLGMMSVLMSHLTNIPHSILANVFACPPTGVTTYISEERKQGIAHFRCTGFGDVTHLKAQGLNPSFHGRFCEVYSSKDRH